MSGSPFSPDLNYEYDAPHYVDFAQLPSDAELDAWFRSKSDSSPTMVKAPVLFQLEAARAASDDAELCSVLSDDGATAVADNDDADLTVTAALAARFENASDAALDDVGRLDEHERDQDAASESSFDSVATEVINFAAAPTATPSTLKTTQMLQRCDATQDELTLRIAALKSQIQQLRASVPPAPVLAPAAAPTVADHSAAPFSHTPRSAYLEAVSRVKKNIGLVADKETELHQLQLLQREMHLSKTPQEKQVRAPRHSSAHQRRQSTHASAVRVLRNESAYMTPSRHHQHNADATGPVRLMATGPMRVIDPSQQAPPHHHHYPAVTPRPAVVPGTVLKRQQSLLHTGALRIDTAAAAAAAAASETAMAAEAASESDSEELAHAARPSSAHRRRSHSRHSTPRRPHSHRTPRSPAMYDEDAVGGESRHHRRHHTPRATAEHETPRSTAHRARSHSRGHRRSEAAAEPAAEKPQHGERRRRHRSHSRGEHREHRHHRLRAESVPPTPAQASVSAPATRMRSSTIETSSPARAPASSIRRTLDTERDFQALPRFMQPTESAAMRATEQKRDNERRKIVTNPRDHWEIAAPAPVRHTISQLDREAVQKAQQLAALSPPPLPGPPAVAPPKPALARGWSLAPPQPVAAALPPSQSQPQPQPRPIARSESLATATAASRSAKPVVRSSTMTTASARQPLRPMALGATGNKPPAPPVSKRDAHDRMLTTEERELLEIAKARRELHEHVMSHPVGMPKFVRRPASKPN